jgi:hypothetical protein
MRPCGMKNIDFFGVDQDLGQSGAIKKECADLYACE